MRWTVSPCLGATKLVHQNCWDCALEPRSHNYWSPGAGARSPQQEKPLQRKAQVPQLESSRCFPQLEKRAHVAHLAQPNNKIKLKNKSRSQLCWFGSFQIMFIPTYPRICLALVFNYSPPAHTPRHTLPSPSSYDLLELMEILCFSFKLF